LARRRPARDRRVLGAEHARRAQRDAIAVALHEGPGRGGPHPGAAPAHARAAQPPPGAVAVPQPMAGPAARDRPRAPLPGPGPRRRREQAARLPEEALASAPLSGAAGLARVGTALSARTGPADVRAQRTAPTLARMPRL